MKTSFLLAAMVLPAWAGAVDVQVDVSQGRHAISPDVYGINGGDDAQPTRLGAPVRRWGGGNPSTRYNWKSQMANRAKDWYFESIPNSQGNADPFISATVAANVKPLIPLTTIGWISKGDGSQRYCGFSVAKYGPQQCTAPDDSDCGNGAPVGAPSCYGGCYCSEFISATTDPHDTSFDAGAPWAQEWVAHLAPEGVHLYQLDNEPGIWNSTHHDVHPQRTTYAEMRSDLFDFGSAVKAADPAGLVLGPVSWGWTEYEYLTYVNGNNPEHDAHGAFIPWYLDQAHAYEVDAGTRILDYLDVHYYPQEPNVYSSATDAKTNAARLQATRSLWDPTFTDPTWINTPVMLVPRMHGWVDQHYPGTKLAITEYCFGASDTAVGAIAEADVLGIFGREAVDLATLFSGPSGASSIGEDAFKLYRNYDGAGAQFGTTSVSAATSAVDQLTAYAAEVSPGKLTVVLINKDTNTHSVAVTLAGIPGGGTWKAFAFGSAGRLSSAGSGTATGSTLSYTLASYTAQLVEYTAPAGSVDAGNPADGDAGYRLDGGTPLVALGSCGCSSGGPWPWTLGSVALALRLLTVRRRNAVRAS